MDLKTPKLWSFKRENGDEPSKLGISYIQTNPCVLLAQGNVGDGEKNQEISMIPFCALCVNILDFKQLDSRGGSHLGEAR